MELLHEPVCSRQAGKEAVDTSVPPRAHEDEQGRSTSHSLPLPLPPPPAPLPQEASVLRQIRHRNVVNFAGLCVQGGALQQLLLSGRRKGSVRSPLPCTARGAHVLIVAWSTCLPQLTKEERVPCSHAHTI